MNVQNSVFGEKRRGAWKGGGRQALGGDAGGGGWRPLRSWGLGDGAWAGRRGWATGALGQGS